MYMKRFLYLLSGIALSGLAVSCKPTIDEPNPSSSDQVNLNKYVAVGDYYTAGFYNGGLNRESQQYAYPALLAQQFSRFNGNSVFEQPYFSPGAGTQMLTASFSADGKLVLSNGEEFSELLRSACDGMTKPFNDHYSNPAESLQNLGIPGLRIQQITNAGAGNVNTTDNKVFNPYYERILPPNTNRTYIQTVGAAKPTFFTLWIGMADIINYAMSGGTCGTLPLASATSPSIPNFRAAFIPALDTLTKRRTFTTLAEQSGIVIDLPSIKDLAFTRTTPSLQIQQALRTQANNNNLTIYISRQLPTGAQVVPVAEDDIILPKGLATLNTMTSVGGQTSLHGLSPDNPLTNEEVLDGTEINSIEQTTESYNTIIANRLKDVRTSDKQPLYGNKVIVVSAKQLFGQLRNGLIYNGVKYSSQPVTGGVFSFDNFSLTPRGQALVANKIIQKMNTPTKEGGFGTSIPEIDVNSLPPIKLP